MFYIHICDDPPCNKHRKHPHHHHHHHHDHHLLSAPLTRRGTDSFQGLSVLPSRESLQTNQCGRNLTTNIAGV